MRQGRLLSVAVVGIFLLATSAIAIAGNWDWGGTSETYGPAEGSSSMESGSGATSPDQGNYESQETLEAGKLPSGEKTMNSGGEFPSGTDFQTYEISGRTYRAGIDDGP